ncbi:MULTISPECIES: DUF6916 family protein [Shewanella]|uniref:DUF6916 family protein n=1 Tax=Shewanella TaxID=22 RepID=UPI001674812E|nr:hypothetical protein [Shewanella fodinae]MCL2907555.1 hypothetical protein [Shewanella fodinae]GGZ09776.1 hypothetical protein GCM10007169_27980 [Shewanella fodinae]
MLPTHKDFKSQLNQKFTVVYDASFPPEILTLTCVSDVSSIGGGFDSYGMTFSAPLGKGYLQQKQRQMRNDVLGDLSLFLVPSVLESQNLPIRQQQ